jgi:hypothetical protein
MFASQEMLIDSNWAIKFQQLAHKQYISLMGYESNNPIHDDHQGKGKVKFVNVIELSYM